MLRKLSTALAGAFLVAGAVTAQAAPGYPTSITEAGPNYAAPGDGLTRNPFGAYATGRRQVSEPSQVDDAHPAHTAGQRMPTMEGGRGATSAGAAGALATPSSVDESHPAHTGGQSMPSMSYGR